VLLNFATTIVDFMCQDLVSKLFLITLLLTLARTIVEFCKTFWERIVLENEVFDVRRFKGQLTSNLMSSSLMLIDP